MIKKFVALNANASPSENPYEVRTYMGDNTKAPEWKVTVCQIDHRCKATQNSTLSKVLTIEDEIRRLHEKAKESRFHRTFKKRCNNQDEFLACVVPQRTGQELKSHAVLREQYLKTQNEINFRIHDASELPSEFESLIKLASPMTLAGEEEDGSEYGSEEMEEEGEEKGVKPRLASPECSLEIVYMPTRKMLDITRQKSGLFHNETDPPCYADDGIGYSEYDPRTLQEEFDAQNLKKIDLIEGKSPADLWTWNVGIQDAMDKAYIEATIPKLDCANMELTAYHIPKDLEKTFTVEIVFGCDAIRKQPPRRREKLHSLYNRPKEMTCIFVAFVESYRTNPDFWTAETMDGILLGGERLYQRSVKLNYKSDLNDFDIITTLTEKSASIDLKVHYSGPLGNEPNIYKTLALFFVKYNACVLVSNKLYLLMWKRCASSFFVFDPNGRNELCQRDWEEGKCSLMATRYVEHLVHLILRYSEEDLGQEFTLYEISFFNYGKITRPAPTSPLPKPFSKLWAVVNDTYAVIPATKEGLQQPVSGDDVNPSLMISLLALMYAHIDHPHNWRPEMLDEFITFGTLYTRAINRKMKAKPRLLLNIVDLPEVLTMGAYTARLEKTPFLYTGHVADCRNFVDSQLTIALKELFNNEWDAALLQIDNSVMAVWRDRQFFYLYDPFKRGRAGQVLDPEDYRARGVSCLQIHTSFESLCRVLFQKAIKMRRGGKFFLHGIKVGCIRPKLKGLDLKPKFPSLRLEYPRYKSDAEAQSEKTKELLERKYSIESIPDEEVIPDFDDEDVVECVFEEVLCEIFEKLAEPLPERPTPYKQVKKVLLGSDGTYLEALKYKLKHGEDYENLYTDFRTQRDPTVQPISLEEELQIPSNYISLPDGAWVIFGTSQLPVVDDEVSKLGGLLSGIVTAAASTKYKISTWNSDLIEYAIDSANSFGEEYRNYKFTLKALLNNTLPKISIGDNTYVMKAVKSIKLSKSCSLRQVLLETLMNNNRIFVICQRFSCLLIKRYNFLYMFIGFPCNAVGYRKFGSGPSCMLRFIELDALIRRIEFGCNPQGCDIQDYVIVAIKVIEQVDSRYKKLTPSDEEAAYAIEYQRIKELEQRRLTKMRFLDDQLSKENKRLEDFLKEKDERASRLAKRGRRAVRSKKSETEPSGGDYSMYLDEYEEFEEEIEEEEEISLKHKPGKVMRKERMDKFKPRPIIYGYRMREKDCLFKIQGSKALEGRQLASTNEIKACFFTSVLAILYAIMRPLSEWTTHRIDRVIECGEEIASRVANMTTAFERLIKNITVDDFEFDVWVKIFNPTGASVGPCDYKITKALQARKYVLLQTANTTYVLHRDEYYHLFDPYGSMEKVEESENEEEESGNQTDGKQKSKCPKGLDRYGERNTASWVLFPDVKSMLTYIDERATNEEWQRAGEYSFHVIDILSYKKAPQKTRILQVLTDLSIPMKCKITQHGEDESAICAYGENMNWLELENCLPIWSRMNRRNTAGKYRNLPVSKYRKYDIEIEGRLWSLWGNLSPMAPVFSAESRGKQFLACNVVACCAAMIYHLTDWSGHLLDTIVISGDRYHRESLEMIKREDYEFSIEDLNYELTMENVKFLVHLEHVVYGRLYCQPTQTKMNLSEALMYFFGHFQFGIIQCQKRTVAIGRTMGHNGGYFMFDCQSRDHPIFPKGQGASYVLRTKHLQVLLYCIVISLNITFYNMQFTIHKVEVLREGASVDDAEEEADEENTGEEV